MKIMVSVIVGLLLSSQVFAAGGSVMYSTCDTVDELSPNLQIDIIDHFDGKGESLASAAAVRETGMLPHFIAVDRYVDKLGSGDLRVTYTATEFSIVTFQATDLPSINFSGDLILSDGVTRPFTCSFR
jgi:hypothetical protein